MRLLSLSNLNRKLLRDLWAMKGQAFAIATVVAAGVAMYVMYLSNFESLRETRRIYYERQRFGDVFASLKRAPLRVAADLADIPRVATVETRVVVNVSLDIEDLDEPAMGQLVSVPANRRPQVNDLFLRRGRWIERGRPDEVLASEGFVIANKLDIGDQVPAVINGRLRRLTIVGVALSPEFIYSIKPGDLVPDDRRYGIFWMEQQALAAAFDMEGGFNDVVFGLSPGASTDEVIDRVDRILAAYGGRGAVPRALQLSHWMVENELAQLQNFGFMLPLVFLMVAAFILNVALTRALALQRPQIASLKALGYRNTAIGWHYLKWALVIGAAGVVFGIVLGASLGTLLIDLYNRFFRFPTLIFAVPARVIVGATTLTMAAAGLGAFGAVRRAVRVPPAEAMRPEAPARYRRSIFETPVIARHLGNAGRMVLRNLTRHPLRAAASVFGIAFAVAILMIGFVFTDAIERLIQVQFWQAERQDVTVFFVEPRSDAARHELTRLPGVLAVEPIRNVPVRVRSGHRQRYLFGGITGMPPTPRFRHIIHRDGRSIPPPAAGLVMSAMLARVLDVHPGDTVTVEVLEGHRPIRDVQVTGIVDDIIGLEAYMDIGRLHDLMREAEVANGARLLIDQSREAELSAGLKRIPSVAGAAFKRVALESFRDVLAANMNLTIFMNVIFASCIAFGVVYNAARVSLSERSRELASLRVLGFTRAEISLILMGELALLTLTALPAGGLFGYGLAAVIVRSIDSEVYRFPLYITSQTVAISFLGIIAAAVVSGLMVRRRLDQLDLVAVLKIRE
jgi:putative ABC transport system permease protein